MMVLRIVAGNINNEWNQMLKGVRLVGDLCHVHSLTISQPSLFRSTDIQTPSTKQNPPPTPFAGHREPQLCPCFLNQVNLPLLPPILMRNLDDSDVRQQPAHHVGTVALDAIVYIQFVFGVADETSFANTLMLLHRG